MHEISTRTSTKKRNIFLSLVRVLISFVSPVWPFVKQAYAKITTHSLLCACVFFIFLCLFRVCEHRFLKPGSHLWNKHKKIKNTRAQNGLCVVFFAYACSHWWNKRNKHKHKEKCFLFLCLCLCLFHKCEQAWEGACYRVLWLAENLMLILHQCLSCSHHKISMKQA